MTQTPQSTETGIRLQRGQTHWEQLRPGTLIRVTTGSLVVRRQVWLETTLVKQTHHVMEGGVYGVPACGWFELAAQTDVDLLLVAPARATPLTSRVRWHSLRRVFDKLAPQRLEP